MNPQIAPSDSAPLSICAELPPEWKEELDALLFDNPRQAALERQILATIREFGLPRTRIADGRLRIALDDGIVLGSLFAIVESEEGAALAGALLFLRKNSAMLCLHLSVDEPFALGRPRASLRVASRLLEELRRIASLIAGVDRVEIYCKRAGWMRLPLSSPLA